MDFGNLCRFGWATQRASFNLGTDGFGYGFGGTAMKSNGSFEKYGETFTTGDRVGCRLDLVKVSVGGEGDLFILSSTGSAAWGMLCSS